MSSALGAPPILPWSFCCHSVLTLEVVMKSTVFSLLRWPRRCRVLVLSVSGVYAVIKWTLWRDALRWQLSLARSEMARSSSYQSLMLCACRPPFCLILLPRSRVAGGDARSGRAGHCLPSVSHLHSHCNPVYTPLLPQAPVLEQVAAVQSDGGDGGRRGAHVWRPHRPPQCIRPRAVPGMMWCGHANQS